MKPAALAFTTAALLATTGLCANAETLLAVGSAEIRPNGIRVFQDSVSTAFHNIQTSGSNFSTFAILDFDPPAPAQPFVELDEVQLALSQSNAPFTRDGDIEFFVATDTRALTIDDAATFQSGNGSSTVGSQFGTLYSLGGGTFTETETGDIDIYNFTLSNDAEAFLLSQINAGNSIRIIGTPNDSGVAATYGGAEPFEGVATPTFSYRGVVPEPSSLALLGLGGLLVARRRRGQILTNG